MTDTSCDREQICVHVSSAELFLPWTGADTSPAQPPVGPDTPGPQNRMAPTRTGAACTSRRLLGASAVAWRCEGRGKYSHHRTHSSGTGGTASVREDTLLRIRTCTRAVRPTAVGQLTWIKMNIQSQKCHQYDTHISSKSYRLRAIFTFQQNVSCHVHIHCLWPDCHIRGWRGGWRSYRWGGWQASDHSSRLRLQVS